MEYIYPVESCLQKTKGNQNSDIQNYFAGSTVFVTGATGFLGRLLVEKLLRSCHDLKKIYILVRTKKDKTPEERFKEYFDNVVKYCFSLLTHTVLCVGNRILYTVLIY